jgi:hypothetical protein
LDGFARPALEHQQCLVSVVGHRCPLDGRDAADHDLSPNLRSGLECESMQASSPPAAQLPWEWLANCALCHLASFCECVCVRSPGRRAVCRRIELPRSLLAGTGRQVNRVPRTTAMPTKPQRTAPTIGALSILANIRPFLLPSGDVRCTISQSVSPRCDTFQMRDFRPGHLRVCTQFAKRPSFYQV